MTTEQSLGEEAVEISTTEEVTRQCFYGVDGSEIFSVPMDLLQSHEDKGSHLYLVQVIPETDLHNKQRSAEDFFSQISRTGDVLESQVGQDEEPTEAFQLLYATVIGPSLVGSLLQIPSEQIEPIVYDPGETPLPPPPCSEVEEKIVEKAQVQPVVPPKKQPNLLDHLLDLAGDLLQSRVYLGHSIKEGDLKAIAAAAKDLDEVSEELQQKILLTRSQPLSRIFSAAQLRLEEAAKLVGRNLEVVVEGQEVELDRAVLESLLDPLSELLVLLLEEDVEMPVERVAAGKPSTAKIAMHAEARIGEVYFELHCDGKGSDLRDQEGFSHIEETFNRMGGGLTTSYDLEGGTCIRIVVPFSFTLSRGTIVSVEDQRFVVPAAKVEDCLHMDLNELSQRVQRRSGRAFLKFRGGEVPIVDLRQVLGTFEPYRGERSNVSIVVVSAVNELFGIAVDEIFETRNIVVKALGRYFEQCSLFSGATFSESGAPVLILDIGGIFSVMDMDRTCENDGPLLLKAMVQPQAYLLFRGGEQSHGCVPLHEISKVERVERSKVFFEKGQACYSSGEGDVSVRFLGDATNTSLVGDDHLNLLFLGQSSSEGAGPVALAVDEVLEVIHEALIFEESSSKEPWIAGEAQYQGMRLFALNKEVLLSSPGDDAFAEVESLELAHES